MLLNTFNAGLRNFFGSPAAVSFFVASFITFAAIQ